MSQRATRNVKKKKTARATSTRRKTSGKKKGTQHTPQEVRIAHRKARLLKALEQSSGLVTHACRLARVCRQSFYRFYNSDAVFRKRADACMDQRLDEAEAQLQRNIRAGKEASLIFFLKCRGKKRGYLESEKIDQDAVVNIIVGGKQDGGNAVDADLF